MGVTTDAKLFYGILIEEGSEAADRIEAFDEVTDAAESNPLGYLSIMGGALDGVELVYHCSDRVTLYAITPKGCEIRANRGYPQKVKSVLAEPSQMKRWDETLRGFCTKHGVTWTKPQWFLASYWG